MIKQRIARKGGGRSGGFSTIVLFRRGALAFFVYGLAKSDFDVRTICDGNKDLYIVAPPRFLEQVRAWLRLWIVVPDAVASEHVGQGRKDTLVILDEMLKLGYLAPAMKAFTIAAGARVPSGVSFSRSQRWKPRAGNGTPKCSWTTRNTTRSWGFRTSLRGTPNASPLRWAQR